MKSITEAAENLNKVFKSGMDISTVKSLETLMLQIEDMTIKDMLSNLMNGKTEVIPKLIDIARDRMDKLPGNIYYQLFLTLNEFSAENMNGTSGVNGVNGVRAPHGILDLDYVADEDFISHKELMGQASRYDDPEEKIKELVKIAPHKKEAITILDFVTSHLSDDEYVENRNIDDDDNDIDDNNNEDDEALDV